MNLIANDCVNCRRPVGYVTRAAIKVPTLCLACAGSKEVMKEWGHKIAARETPILEVMRDCRDALSAALRVY